MSDEREVIFDDDNAAIEIPDEDIQWSHEVLNQFELLIDTLGIETVMFLMSQEHEEVVSSWVSNKVDIQHRTKQ